MCRATTDPKGAFRCTKSTCPAYRRMVALTKKYFDGDASPANRAKTEQLIESGLLSRHSKQRQEAAKQLTDKDDIMLAMKDPSVAVQQALAMNPVVQSDPELRAALASGRPSADRKSQIPQDPRALALIRGEALSLRQQRNLVRRPETIAKHAEDGKAKTDAKLEKLKAQAVYLYGGDDDDDFGFENFDSETGNWNTPQSRRAHAFIQSHLERPDITEVVPVEYAARAFVALDANAKLAVATAYRDNADVLKMALLGEHSHRAAWKMISTTAPLPIVAHTMATLLGDLDDKESLHAVDHMVDALIERKEIPEDYKTDPIILARTWLDKQGGNQIAQAA